MFVGQEDGAGNQFSGSRATLRGGGWARRKAGRQSKGCLASWQREPSGRTRDPGFRAGAGARHEFSMKRETWDHGYRLCSLEQLASSHLHAWRAEVPSCTPQRG